MLKLVVIKFIVKLISFDCYNYLIKINLNYKQFDLKIFKLN